MDALRKLFNNFWFCLSMAVMNLYFLALKLEASEGWILSAVGVLAWAYLAWRTTRPEHLSQADIDMTPDQVMRMNKVTRQFKIDMEAIINEDKDNGSNNGKDKETDTKQSKDD